VTEPGYYDTSLPPSLLVGRGRRGTRRAQAGVGDASRAAAGSPTPGDQLSPPQLVAGPAGYTPHLASAERPRNLQELAERAQPDPRTPWAAGEWVAIGRSGKRAHWTGTEWHGGESPGYPAPAQPATEELPAQPATPPPPYRATATQFPGDEQPGDLTR
jgi:hypothetical protein